MSYCTGLDKVEGRGNMVFHAGTAMEDGNLVTSGGRVLVVMATDPDLQKACDEAQAAAGLVKFTDSYHRKDIGFRVLNK